MRWPDGLPGIDPEAVTAGSERSRAAFVETSRRLGIDEDLTPYLATLYLPLAGWLCSMREASTRPLAVGITGGQGSGKSTVSALLGVVMAEAFGRTCATLSIDDIYKTRADRERMAREVHPLFVTRGVPGTHEAVLGIGVIESLLAGEGPTPVPSFDKAVDDRRPQAEWPVVAGPVDFVLFEGWCVGARPESESTLAAPINALERNEDPDGTWRRAVNAELEGVYAELFRLIDVQIMLHVGSMDRVYEWRRLQEHKLRRSVSSTGAARSGLRIMSDAEVDRFIAHYERITRRLLEEMPQRADLVLWLDDSHNAARIEANARSRR